MMLVPHRKHTYGTQRSVTDIALLLLCISPQGGEGSVRQLPRVESVTSVRGHCESCLQRSLLDARVYTAMFATGTAVRVTSACGGLLQALSYENWRTGCKQNRRYYVCSLQACEYLPAVHTMYDASVRCNRGTSKTRWALSNSFAVSTRLYTTTFVHKVPRLNLYINTRFSAAACRLAEVERTNVNNMASRKMSHI
jgi:hypothetical protein